VDPVVVEAVNMVRDRFGASGLRDAIVLAERELAVAEAALAELAAAVGPDDAPRGP
jgi:hypothetical protein